MVSNTKAQSALRFTVTRVENNLNINLKAKLQVESRQVTARSRIAVVKGKRGNAKLLKNSVTTRQRSIAKRVTAQTRKQKESLNIK